jgi:hypothetical protein
MGLSDKGFLEVAGSRSTALAVLASITGLYSGTRRAVVCWRWS